MPPKYKKVCPYCGKTCEAYYPKNIFCECGAKYYLKTDTWLERKKKKENPDLVEVVRCKDCKHCEQSPLYKEKGKESKLEYICCAFGNVSPDFYCGIGERSENGK